MVVEVVTQTTSWLQAIICWYLIRLFTKLARGREPWTSSAQPHDAARAIPPQLERHYPIHVGRLTLEDPERPLNTPFELPSISLTAHPAPQEQWTTARNAWFKPLAITPHPLHHPSIADEAAQSHGARVALSRSGTKRLVFFLHGGGFVNPMTAFHWKFASRLSTQLDALVVVQTYTLLPWGGIWDVLPPLLAVYRELQTAASELGVDFIVLGDSAGGSLAAALTLAAKDAGLSPPEQLVLVAPGLDSALSVADAKEAEKQCAILTATGMVVSRRHWAIGSTDPEALVHELRTSTPRASTEGERQAALHPYASPLRADWSWLTAIPENGRKKTKVTVVSGAWDLSYPVSVVPFQRKLQSLGQQVEAMVIICPYSVHDYPIFVDTPLPVFVGAQQGLDLLVSSVLSYSD